MGYGVDQGTAAALMYLMAVSSSEGDTYREGDPSSERQLKLDCMDKAKKFWTSMSNDDPAFKEIKKTYKVLKDSDKNMPSRSVRAAIIAKAWNCYIADERFTEKRIKPEIHEDDKTGRNLLDELVTVGGIDLGPQLKGQVDKDAVEASKAEARQKGAEEIAKTGKRGGVSQEDEFEPSEDDLDELENELDEEDEDEDEDE